MTLPEFSLRTADGTTFGDADIRSRGRTLLVFVRGTGSRHGQRLLTELESQAQKFSAIGVAIVAVTPDDAETAAAWANAAGLSFPLLIDSDYKLARAFGVYRRFIFPRVRTSWFIISERGEIVTSDTTASTVDDVFQRMVNLVAARARR